MRKLLPHRHTYTCPDVIYLQNRNRKILQLNILAVVLLIAGLVGFGMYQDSKEKKERQLTTTP